MATLIPALSTCVHRMTAGEMTMLCPDWEGMERCSRALTRKGLPHRVRKKSGDFQPQDDTIQVMTMYASKGLEWSVEAVLKWETKEGLSKDNLQMKFKFSYVTVKKTTRKVIYEGYKSYEYFI